MKKLKNELNGTFSKKEEQMAKKTHAQYPWLLRECKSKHIKILPHSC
jgi:hypothetical protein